MKRRGIALVGCGTIAEFHLKALREIEQAKVVAIAGRRAEKVKPVAEREGCAAVTDYRELLRRPDVDIIDIVTGSGSHGPIALEALQAGKHVLVEKPMAMTVEQATRVIRTAEEKKLALGVISQRRFEEQNRAIKKVLDEGKLGKLLMIEIASPFYRTQAYYDSAPWRGTIAEDGGALMNQGIHSVDLMLWLAGPAKTVYGRIATRTHKMEAEDLGLALVTFQNGAFGTVMASTSIQPGFQVSLGLYGEKGTIKVEGAAITHWTVPDVPRPEFAQPSTGGGGVSDPKAINYAYHRLQLQEFLAALEEGRPPAVTGRDGRRAVELIEGIYRSASTGAAVSLSGE